MTLYTGKRDRGLAIVLVTRPGATEHYERQLIRTRFMSPVGFDWGYHGSGPADLAHAILTDHYGGGDLGAKRAEPLYKEFADRHVAKWPTDGFMFDTDRIAEALFVIKRDLRSTAPACVERFDHQKETTTPCPHP